LSPTNTSSTSNSPVAEEDGFPNQYLHILDNHSKSVLLSWPYPNEELLLSLDNRPMSPTTISCFHCVQQPARTTLLGEKVHQIMIGYGSITFVLVYIEKSRKMQYVVQCFFFFYLYYMYIYFNNVYIDYPRLFHHHLVAAINAQRVLIYYLSMIVTNNNNILIINEINVIVVEQIPVQNGEEVLQAIKRKKLELNLFLKTRRFLTILLASAMLAV
jgi:hypothetical protein